VAIATVRDFLRSPGTLQEVIFCCFLASDLALYQLALARTE
jgi:O-acetyl-ADP-ribose deacetylase (regulator of RNase III)